MLQHQTLSMEQMIDLKILGVDTSKASVILLFFDEEGDWVRWDVGKNEEDSDVYQYFDDELARFSPCTIKILDAETGDYDHSLRDKYGVFTLQDILDLLPLQINIPEDFREPTHCNLSLNISQDGNYTVSYRSNNSPDYQRIKYTNPSLLKAAYNMLFWLARYKYIKLLDTANI